MKFSWAVPPFTLMYGLSLSFIFDSILDEDWVGLALNLGSGLYMAYLIDKKLREMRKVEKR